MTTDLATISKHIGQLTQQTSVDELAARLEVDAIQARRRLPAGPQQRDERWQALAVSEDIRHCLDHGDDHIDQANIENRIGRMAMPLGVAGPITIAGLHAKGTYCLPLATTEAALVASVHRGCAVLSRSGGVRTLLLAEGVTRSPVFIWQHLSEVGQFVVWLAQVEQDLIAVADATTAHGSLQRLRVNVEANHVYLLCDYQTGDAAGQNMVTIATQALCDYICQHSPVTPQRWYIEGNASGDKKATAQSFGSVRGRKVSAEAVIPAKLLQRYLHTSAQDMAQYWQCSAIGGILSGSIGAQGHYANILAAVFIATGQDAACVSEAAVGLTRFEITPEGDLYVAVTLPNMIVGTVGGGTGLPHQAACLEIMGLRGTGHARALAEVCAAAALAGEVSIIASLAAGDFAQAHQRLARERRTDNVPA